jgi:cathepsin L
MTKALLGTALASLASASLIPFDAFIELHGRSYERGGKEYFERRTLYEKRIAAAEAHNSDPDRLWTAGVNKLWDWTDSEMQSLRGWDGSARPEGAGLRSVRPHSTFLQSRSEDLPTEKLWSVTATNNIRNQGDCGSCWAIAASTVLAAHTEIHTGTVRTFSAQQIVDCTPNPKQCGGDGGCKGATAELAMDWVLANGCGEENDDPYQAQDGQCPGAGSKVAMAQIFGEAPANGGGAAFGMVGWETLPKNEYEPVVRALAERGPVAVSVAADAWFNYESGIFNGCDKDAVIDHAVTAIGYGQEDGTKYWVIQNSWGSDWGEGGRIRMQRHDADTYCGMNNKPELGVACKGDTTPVPVCGMCGVLFDSVVPHFKEASR